MREFSANPNDDFMSPEQEENTRLRAEIEQLRGEIKHLNNCITNLMRERDATVAEANEEIGRLSRL